MDCKDTALVCFVDSKAKRKEKKRKEKKRKEKKRKERITNLN
jgi:hypothetical protein